MTAAATPPAAAAAPRETPPADGTAPGTLPAGEAGTATPVVTPFWQRMPRLFLFPLQRPPLLRNLAATVLFSVIVWIGIPELQQAPLRWGLLIFLCWVGTSLYIARFGFLVIERTAAGYLDSRSYPRQEAEPDWWRPLKMFVVLVFVPLVILLAGKLLLPPSMVVILLLVFTLLLPASVMVLTMTDSFGDAVNPARCLQTATRIGPPYLLLCLFLFMLFISYRQATGLLLGGQGAAAGAHAAGAEGAEAGLAAARGTLGASTFVITLVWNYFLVLMCTLIGYAMYQYSGVLGIDVIGPGEAQRGGAVSAAAHERRVREAMIGKLIAAGQLREAMDLISDEMRTRPNDLSLHVRMRKLLLHEGSAPRIEAHADRYLELLLAKSNFKEALALYEETRAMFPAFVPHDVGRLPQLAGAAIDALKPDLAAELIRGFDKKYRGHPKVPDVYVIGARIMLQADHAKEARRLLEYVTKNHEGTPAAAEARRYLARFAVPAPATGPATLSGRATVPGPATVSGPVTVPGPATVTVPGPATVRGPATVPGPATVAGPATVPGPATVSGPVTVPGPATVTVPGPATVAGPATEPGPVVPEHVASATAHLSEEPPASVPAPEVIAEPASVPAASAMPASETETETEAMPANEPGPETPAAAPGGPLALAEPAGVLGPASVTGAARAPALDITLAPSDAARPGPGTTGT